MEWTNIESKFPDDTKGPVNVRFKLTNGDVLTGYFFDGDWQWELKDKPWLSSKKVTHWMYRYQ